MVNLTCAIGDTSPRARAVHPAATPRSSTGVLRLRVPGSPLRTSAEVCPQQGSALFMGARFIDVRGTEGYTSTEFDPGTTVWRAPV